MVRGNGTIWTIEPCVLGHLGSKRWPASISEIATHSPQHQPRPTPSPCVLNNTKISRVKKSMKLTSTLTLTDSLIKWLRPERTSSTDSSLGGCAASPSSSHASPGSATKPLPGVRGVLGVFEVAAVSQTRVVVVVAAAAAAAAFNVCVSSCVRFGSLKLALANSLISSEVPGLDPAFSCSPRQSAVP